MDKYIMYLRKSQMDRDFEDISVEETLNRHHKMLSEFAAQKKLYVEHVLKEVVSGESLSARPMMQKCLELVNTGDYAGVICKDIDRLSRGDGVDSGYITQVLKWNNCKIITPQKTYDLMNDQDEQFTDMKFLFSRYELKTITKRLQDGLNATVREGKYVGSSAPYGYEKIKLQGQKGYSLKPHPEESKIVKMIYDMYVNQNMGYTAIANELNSMGILTNKKNKWSVRTLQSIITNPVYNGKIRWKREIMQKQIIDGKLVKKKKLSNDYEVHEGLHEAIIDDDLWQRAQIIRKNRYIVPAKLNTTIQTPFAGLLYCKHCGSAIRRGLPSKKQMAKRKTKPWYCCKNRCGARMIKCETLDDAILDKMKEWFANYKIELKKPEIQVDNTQVALDIVIKQINSLQVQQDKLCELLETGVYSAEMFVKRNSVITTELENLKKKQEELQKEVKTEIKKDEFVPMVQSLFDSYDILEPVEKNRIWKLLLEKVTCYRAPGAEKNDFEIHIYPKIPT